MWREDFPSGRVIGSTVLSKGDRWLHREGALPNIHETMYVVKNEHWLTL